MVKYKAIKKVIETPEQLRAKYPKELIQAFVAVSKAGWEEPEYKIYRELADAHLGGKPDPIDYGRLIVHLASATMDLRQKEKSNVEKKVKKIEIKKDA